MDLKVLNAGTCTIDTINYRRKYAVRTKSSGLLLIYDTRNGRTIFDNINPNTVTIDGSPMRSVTQLEDILYNRSCECTSGGTLRYKIFDYTFDNTFE